MTKEALEYFEGDELCADTHVSKYALRSPEGTLLELSPDNKHRRMAKEFARVEVGKFKNPYSEDFVYELFKDYKYIIPQGSPMYGIGNPKPVSLSNCYVLESPVDSYSGILYTDTQLVNLSKRRAGVGLDLSNLRPAGYLTNNSANTSSGIIPFATRYSNSINEVAQEGRRGALMQTLSVHHPQILDFIRCKEDKTKVTGCNISVKLTDEFLEAVDEGTDYELRWPVDSNNVYARIPAKLLWDEIINNSWKCAEPGVLFFDTIIRECPADCYANYGFRTISTNPCGEIPLCALDSCRLLCLNLYSFVENPFTPKAYFNFDKFYEYSKIAQRLMDDLVDLELEKIQQIIGKVNNDPEGDHVKNIELDMWVEIKRKCSKGRRTGTGITGLGDAIAALGLAYCSDKALDIDEEIYKTLKLGCYRSSVDMAMELGAFELWDKELEKDCPFLKRIGAEDPQLWEDMQKYGRRNIALLTTAPTGSVSILTRTTSGIEPLFKTSYIRKKKINVGDVNTKVDFVDANGEKWQEYEVFHHKLKVWMEVTGKSNVKESPYYKSCANDLDWEKRVELQGRITKHIDHSLSSTVNLPEDVTMEEVGKIFMRAWKSGCKGITVYRDRCRDGVLVDKSQSSKGNNSKKRPKVLPCNIHHMTVLKEKYISVIGLLDEQPYEIFASQNFDIDKTIDKGIIRKKARGEYTLEDDKGNVLVELPSMLSEYEETVTRLISVSLRHGVPLNFIVDQLEKTHKKEFICFTKCLGRSLKRYIKDGAKVSGANCEKCGGAELKRSEGCIMCNDCGWSKCN